MPIIPVDDSSQPKRSEVAGPAFAATARQTYPAPWRGELLLACTKCQKKLKKHKASKSLASLKKFFKKQKKANENQAPDIRVLGVDCLKMCPKGGVTIARQRQLAERGAEVSILRAEADLLGLYTLIAREQSRGGLGKTA